MVVFALFAAEFADVGDAQGDDGQRGIDLQSGKIVVGKSGAHVGEAGQAQVGLVGAVLAHGVVVGDARKRRGQGDAGSGPGSGAEFFDDTEDVVAAREGHLQIDLGELELAIGALIFVAEAAGDLEVAVEAGDHEDLLEDLRRLRQRVELAGMDAAGNEEIARAFGCGLVEDGRFDFQKSLAPRGSRGWRG